MMPHRPAAVALSLLLAACAGPPRLGPPVPEPFFTATGFFDGRTEGRGMLRTAMSPARPVAVHGTGQMEPDGTLVLTQIVERPAKSPRTRSWRIREVSPGRYAGTLSDAIGPVTGEASGNQLHLAFAAKGGLRVQQWLTLAADGQSAANIMQVRKLGVVVAVLHETITRVPPANPRPAGQSDTSPSSSPSQ